jgi:TRAP-type C4-dicarboxylate transport system permease small subunit
MLVQLLALLFFAAAAWAVYKLLQTAMAKGHGAVALALVPVVLVLVTVVALWFCAVFDIAFDANDLNDVIDSSKSKGA